MQKRFYVPASQGRDDEMIMWDIQVRNKEKLSIKLDKISRQIEMYTSGYMIRIYIYKSNAFPGSKKISVPKVIRQNKLKDICNKPMLCTVYNKTYINKKRKCITVKLFRYDKIPFKENFYSK